MRDDQLLLLALCKIKGVDWHLVAREAARPNGLEGLLSGRPSEHSVEAIRAVGLIEHSRSQIASLTESARIECETADKVGAHLSTVLDSDYPRNLRAVPNLPPFLFIKGQVKESDTRSIAVVGTRDASDSGVNRATRMSQLLVERGITVVSGLARGIDTAAHRSALESGGRTIAVIGTGIQRTFPRENMALSEAVAERGALVSQFWPNTPPATYTFPRRNITMSGISLGTLVVEASRTSGAKMQARLALEHGKKVFLLQSLIESQSWAEQYSRHRGAVAVRSIDDVMYHLTTDPDDPRKPTEDAPDMTDPAQLALDVDLTERGR